MTTSGWISAGTIQRQKAVIQSYFGDYVENSQTARPVLGEEEFEIVQTFTTTKTTISHWKSLVAEADNTILRVKRREDPSNHRLWKLRWDQGEPEERPIGDISRVSRINSIEVRESLGANKR